MVIGAVLAGLLALVFIWSLVDAGRRPQRYEQLYSERLWKRVKAWVWGLTLAAVVGMALGGAGADTLGVVAAVGFIAGFICARFIASARVNRWLRDYFKD